MVCNSVLGVKGTMPHCFVVFILEAPLVGKVRGETLGLGFTV